jgi:alkanesulfonate monooxygenase SsuD/methylene tetrahydromethanopterin reductase-like flavin-dependent oxidoreductase (luciferase family)
MTAISLFHPAGEFEAACEAVQRAEAMGFDGCLFGEHHGAPGNDRPNLLIYLAALAARTKTIKLGTSILLSALYNPVHIAEMASMVDNISGGRLILGLGMGYQPQDFDHFGIPFNQKVSRFEESVQVVQKAFREERFSFHGRRFNFDNVAVYPRPVQQPHPPIWLAAWSHEGAKRAGRLGGAYVTDPIQNLTATAAFAADYREAASANDSPAEIIIMRELLCAESRQEAIDRFAPGLLGTYRYYWSNNAFNTEYESWTGNVKTAGDLTFEMLAADRVIYGTPDDCAGQLEHWINTLGASHVQVTVPHAFGPDVAQRQLATIDLLGKTLVPAVHVMGS